MVQILSDALARLSSASKQPARSRSQPVDRVVRTICESAYNNGLSKEHLLSVIGIVRKPSHLDQGTITQLVRNLYPSEPVSAEAVYNVISSIGPGSERPSVATQALLLQWLLLVREALPSDGENALLNSYAVLFNQLQALGTRPTLCHLLATLTRRKHVKPWRIRVLLALGNKGSLDLTRNASMETGLIGLLRVYKDFYPGIVLDQSLGRVRVTGFKAPDHEWRQRLAYLISGQADGRGVDNKSSFRVLRRGAKRMRGGTIPEVYTADASENTTSLEEIDGVADFVERLAKIEPPSQMISAMEDPLLRRYLHLKDNEILRGRIDTWLSFYLEAQLADIEEADAEDKTITEILHKLLYYLRSTKSMPPPVVSFLHRLVNQWDGQLYQKHLLELFAFLPLQPFEDLYAALFLRLEDCLLSTSTNTCLPALLQCYTYLLRRWTVSLLHSPNIHASSSLQPLATHASLLAKQICVASPSVEASSAVLQYLYALSHVAQLATTHPNMRIISPDAYTVYLLAFEYNSLTTLSPLCDILARYKVAFETSMASVNARASSSQSQSQSQPSPTSPVPGKIVAYPRDYVNAFNGFLMDICNLVWRSRAFNDTDTNARGCLITGSIQMPLREHLGSLIPPLTLNSAFSLSMHPALAAAASAAMDELQDHVVAKGQAADADAMQIDGSVESRHTGPVTQKSLALLESNGGPQISWSEYRLEVLRWLEAHGVGGVSRLMFCTMKLLMGQAEKRARDSEVKAV